MRAREINVIRMSAAEFICVDRGKWLMQSGFEKLSASRHGGGIWRYGDLESWKYESSESPNLQVSKSPNSHFVFAHLLGVERLEPLLQALRVLLVVGEVHGLRVIDHAIVD